MIPDGRASARAHLAASDRDAHISPDAPTPDGQASMTAATTPSPGTARTRTCTFAYDRIVRARFNDGAEVTGDDARENLAATAALTGGRRVPVLVDLRRLRSQTPEARALFAGPEGTRVTLALALLIASPLSRVIGNFFLGFNRPETPARLFTDEREAEAWLLAFLADGTS